MDAGQGQFAITGGDHLSRLRDDVSGWAAGAVAAHGGNDTIGAVLVAAVLNLQRAAGAALRNSAVDCEKLLGTGARGWGEICYGRPLQMRFQHCDQLALLAIADDEIGAGFVQLIGAPLGITAGGDYGGIRVAAAGTAHGFARVGIAGAGDRAGVDDVDIGLAGEGHDMVTAVI